MFALHSNFALAIPADMRVPYYVPPPSVTELHPSDAVVKFERAIRRGARGIPSAARARSPSRPEAPRLRNLQQVIVFQGGTLYLNVGDVPHGCAEFGGQEGRHMAKLMNTKWERFAQSVAAGRTAAQAYAEAGFSPSASNASRLENTPEVQARIAELTEAARAERVKIDKDRLTEMLLADRQAASEAGKLSTALAATIALGKLHGASFNPLNPDHLEKVMPEPEKLGATPDVDFKAMVAKFGACK